MCSALLFLSHSQGVVAQSRLGPERTDLRHFGGDSWSNVTAPVHPNRRAVLPVLGAVGLRDAGLGCAAGHLSSAMLREVIYLLVSRARPRITPSPDQIAVPGSGKWDNHSFLRGHAANSMACASFMAHRFSLGAAEPAMSGYVGAIGLGRMLDGRHWFSDTMAGAMMGFALGKGIADRQLNREAVSAAANPTTARMSIPIVQWSISF